MLGKPHNTSWHALLGLVAIGGYALGALSGATALHPDFGVAKQVHHALIEAMPCESIGALPCWTAELEAECDQLRGLGQRHRAPHRECKSWAARLVA